MSFFGGEFTPIKLKIVYFGITLNYIKYIFPIYIYTNIYILYIYIYINIYIYIYYIYKYAYIYMYIYIYISLKRHLLFIYLDIY